MHRPILLLSAQHTMYSQLDSMQEAKVSGHRPPGIYVDFLGILATATADPFATHRPKTINSLHTACQGRCSLPYLFEWTSLDVVRRLAVVSKARVHTYMAHASEAVFPYTLQWYPDSIGLLIAQHRP